MFFAVIKRQKWFFLGCLLGVACRGNTLGVSPTLLTISPQESIANLTLSNENNVAVTMQLDVVRWQQRNDKDFYTATDNLIVTPQIFTLPPHGTQIVRLGLENPSFGTQEQAYRLFIQEVVSKYALRNKNELKMALRISLPVIIKTSVPIEQRLRWQVLSQQGTTLTIKAENKGNNVLFINLLQAFSAGNQPLTESLTTFAYLLPGSKRVWVMHTLKDKKATSMKAFINDHTSFIDVG